MNRVLTWPVRQGPEVDPRQQHAAPLAPVIVYTLACVSGGALSGLAIAVPAHLVRSAGRGAAVALYLSLAALLVVAVVAQARGRVAPLPQRRRQVERRWLLWRHRSVTAAVFGLMIGSGIFTYLEHAAAYALGVAIAIAPSTGVGVALGALYGLTRGMAVVTTWIGDRFVHRRPNWQALISQERAVSLTLAGTALLAPAAAVLAST